MGVGDDYRLEEVQIIATDPDENYVIQALNFDIIELKRRGLVKVKLMLMENVVNLFLWLKQQRSTDQSKNYEQNT